MLIISVKIFTILWERILQKVINLIEIINNKLEEIDKKSRRSISRRSINKSTRNSLDFKDNINKLNDFLDSKFDNQFKNNFDNAFETNQMQSKKSNYISRSKTPGTKPIVKYIPKKNKNENLRYTPKTSRIPSKSKSKSPINKNDLFKTSYREKAIAKSLKKKPHLRPRATARHSDYRADR